jgi:hypothetical protein
MRLDMFVWDENIGAEISSSPWVQLDTVADATGWIDDEHDEAGTTITQFFLYLLFGTNIKHISLFNKWYNQKYFAGDAIRMLT